MAIQTRYAGDAGAVLNVDAPTAIGSLIATGLTKNPIAFKITLGKSQTMTTDDMTTGNAVETLLKTIAIDSTIVMYQVDTSQVSVLIEATGSNVTAIGSRITALGNISVTAGNVWANAATISGSTGFKIA